MSSRFRRGGDGLKDFCRRLSCLLGGDASRLLGEDTSRLLGEDTSLLLGGECRALVFLGGEGEEESDLGDGDLAFRLGEEFVRRRRGGGEGEFLRLWSRRLGDDSRLRLARGEGLGEGVSSRRFFGELSLRRRLLGGDGDGEYLLRGGE